MTTTLHLFGTRAELNGFLSQHRTDLGAFSWAGMRFVDKNRVYMLKVIERPYDIDSVRGVRADALVVEASLAWASDLIEPLADHLMPSEAAFEAALGPCGK